MMMMKERSLLRITLSLLLCLVTIHPPPNFCTAHSHSEVRCIESERHALLNFKQHLTDPSNRLASWAAASDVDCCHWVGVVCHNRTGHVLQLHLRTFLPLGLYDYLTTDDAQYEAQVQTYGRSMFGDCYAHLANPLVISKYGASGDFPGCMDLSYREAIDDHVDVLDCLVQLAKGLWCAEPSSNSSALDIAEAKELLKQRR